MLSRRTLAWAALAAISAMSQAQSAKEPLSEETYIEPSRAMKDAVLAPWHTHVSATNINRQRTHFIHVESEGMPRIANLARHSINLAGLQIDPTANRSRSATMRQNVGLVVKSLSGEKDVRIEVPSGSNPGTPTWSPDGSRIAFVNHLTDGSYVFLADPKSGRCWRLTARPLLATRVTSVEWVNEGRQIMAVVIPAKRGAAPQPQESPSGPLVRVSDAKVKSLRTYADLLENPGEQTLATYYTNGQLALVSADNGGVTEVGEPRMYSSLDPNPEGKWFIASFTELPFSYLYPYSSFPSRQIIMGADGKEAAELSKRGLPGSSSPSSDPDNWLDESDDEQRGQRGGAQGQNPPAGGAQNNNREEPKRGLSWRFDGAGLGYMQKSPRDRDGKQTDRIMLWKAPFGKDDHEVVWESATDIGSLNYTADGRAFISQSIEGQTVISIIELRRSSTPRKVLSYKVGEDTPNPGSLVTTAAPKTGSVVLLSSDGKSAYLSGAIQPKDPAKEAPRPFLDRLNLEDGKTERIFESAADKYETVQALDDDAKRLLINRQSSSVPNNVFVREGSDEKQLTNNIDYLPEVTQARRERVQITREDGIKFWSTVTLPNYVVTGKGKKAIFWFYPSEVRDQAAINRGARSGNINLFRRPSSSSLQLLILEGYIVVEPDCPIVGAAERPNDGYIPQLRNNLTATIDTLEARDLIDRRLLAIGGHSYGAFSTAHAMIQTPYFKAGIAGDGNFNRSLTPFGFQAEPRQLWQARDVYFEMSPIFMADRLSGALLMYHGAWDQNMGTDPINSPRMYAALEALGKPTAMYIYPYEDHGQIAMESRLDMWARWTAWLDRWLVLPSEK